MGDLSKNFSMVEFRCPHCGEAPNPEDFGFRTLYLTLQRIRDRLNSSVIVTSGYRCPAHNEAVGGAGNSQHLYGTAADVYAPGMSQDDLFNLCKNMYLEGEIYLGYMYKIKGSDRAVHIDVRVPQSNTVRGWTRSKART